MQINCKPVIKYGSTTFVFRLKNTSNQNAGYIGSQNYLYIEFAIQMCTQIIQRNTSKQNLE
jgi:hypothetical protein